MIPSQDTHTKMTQTLFEDLQKYLLCRKINMRSSTYTEEQTNLYGINYNPNICQFRRESALQI